MSDLETIAAEPHYHVWTLYEVAMPWPAFGGGRETMRTMAYIPERTPYAVRSTAWRQLPRFDARPQYGKKGGTVLLCDGGEGCPFHCKPEAP